MTRSTYWSGRSFAFPLFKRLGLHPDGETDETVVQSISCSDAAPTDAVNPYVNGSLHVTGGSSAGIWLRKAGAWVAAAVQGATASFTTLTATTAVSTDTVSERTSAAGVTVDGVLLKDAQVTTDVILEATAASGVTVDGCLIKDGRAAALATASIFTSTEQTGTGSAQNVAHGFGTVPTAVWWSISEAGTGLSGGLDVAPGTHTTTNVVLTVTSGIKFYVHALK